MRPLLALLLLLCLPLPASASVRILSATPAGPVVEGQPVDIVVETDVPVDAARLTFPDLLGRFDATLCALRGRGSRRNVLPYRPGWAGVHSLQLTVTAGACGLRPRTAWRVLRLDAAPAAPAPAPAPAACPGARDVPVPRAMRALRRTVHCLLNAERAAAGVRPLAAAERLRRLASRVAHRRRPRGRRGEQLTVTPGSSPATVVAAWLANAAHRRDLLNPRVRRVGIAVVPRFPLPLRRHEATYAVELG